jgi:hypothetical protein
MLLSVATSCMLPEITRAVADRAAPSGPHDPRRAQVSQTRSCESSDHRLGPSAVRPAPDITMAMVDTFLTKMYRSNADFVFTVTRDNELFVRCGVAQFDGTNNAEQQSG